jgi:N-acetyltransferase
VTGRPTDAEDARARDWFAAPPLRTEHLRLEALRLADAPEYLAALGEPDERDEVVAHLRLPPMVDLAAARSVVAAALTDNDRVAYAQRLSDGTFVGTTSFYEIAPAVRAVAIGHTWVARPWWRSFVNTESKLALLGRAFDDLGAERVVWHTDVRNVRSQAAIARLGAQHEGVLRHHRIRSDGSWRDTVQLAMLAQEWPAARDRLLRLLVTGEDGVGDAGAPRPTDRTPTRTPPERGAP